MKLVAKAHLWFSKLTDGTAISISDLASQQNEDPTEISRFLPLAFLAPTIIESIFTGTQPVDLTIEKLRRIPALPISWSEQHDMLGLRSEHIWTIKWFNQNRICSRLRVRYRPFFGIEGQQ